MALTNGLSGKNGDIKVGGVYLKCQEWDAKISSDKLDVTNKASGGWQETQLGVSRLNGSAKAVWDAHLNANAPPYNVVFLNNSAAIVLEIGDPSLTAGQSTLSFSAVISEVSITSAVAGIIEYSITFESTGTVTHATN